MGQGGMGKAGSGKEPAILMGPASSLPKRLPLCCVSMKDVRAEG